MVVSILKITDYTQHLCFKCNISDKTRGMANIHSTIPLWLINITNSILLTIQKPIVSYIFFIQKNYLLSSLIKHHKMYKGDMLKFKTYFQSNGFGVKFPWTAGIVHTGVACKPVKGLELQLF